ncbi:hypothetical protein YC2023_078254 [Brassica napus]
MDFFKSKYRSYDSKENQGEDHEAFFFFFVSLGYIIKAYSQREKSVEIISVAFLNILRYQNNQLPST